MAFISLLFAGIALLLCVCGVGGMILGLVLKMINSQKGKKGTEKSRGLSVVGKISLGLGVLSLVPILLIVGFHVTSGVTQANRQKKSLEYNVYVDNIDRASTLLENGADPNEYNEYIFPPMYFAIDNDSYDMVKMLLEYGADPDAEGIRNTQMLHFAIQNNRLDLVELLLEYHADINYIMSGRTPLDKAYERKYDDIIDYLIENGAKTRGELEN